MSSKLLFGDFAELRSEKVDPKSSQESFYIGLEHIEQQTLSLVGHGYGSDVDSQKQRFYAGDILFGKLRPYFRKVIVAPFDGICSTDIWVVKPRAGVDRNFLFYWMASEEFIASSTYASEGGRMPRAKWDWVCKFQLQHFSFQEQVAIGNILQVLDQKIAVNKALSKTLEDIAQTIFKSWFIDFDPVKAKMAGEKPAGLNAATAALFPDSMEESRIGLIPKGWGVYPASELFQVGIGRTPPRKEPQWFCKGTEGIPWVSIRDMGTYETYSHGTNEGLTQAAVVKFKVPIVPENSVLMSFKLTVGKLCISDADLVTNEAIAHFRISEDSPLNTFYAYLWLSNLDMGSLDSTSSIGTATNSGVIKQIKFLVPPRELLGNFQEKVSPIFSQLKLLRKQTTNLVLLRDSLLPRLISGELEIPEEMLAS